MDMIERAARALAKEQSGSDDWEGLDAELQEGLRREARAVLAAVREPSMAMMIKGAEAPFNSIDEQDAEHVWQAMLDALLAGEG